MLTRQIYIHFCYQTSIFLKKLPLGRNNYCNRSGRRSLFPESEKTTPIKINAFAHLIWIYSGKSLTLYRL